MKPAVRHARRAAIPIPEGAPSPVGVKPIPYDLARYGASAERRRLLTRRDKEIGAKAIR